MPNLIFLNGTSSAGKTSISKCLQELLLPEIYLGYSIDNILYSLPPSILKLMTTGGDLAALDYDKLVDGYYEAAHALLASGTHLIMDDAVTGERIAQRFGARFGAFRVLKVGLHCELEELKRRELSRGDRTLGEAAWQFPLVHQFLKHDLAVDTTHTDPLENARRIAEFIQSPQWA